MKIGSSIFLIVLGAICSFAISDIIDGVNLGMIGYILMGAGFLGLVLSLLLARPRTTRTATSVRNGVDPATGESITERESIREPGLR